MPTASTDERRRSFDRMAELYARARPPAPPALFDALAAFAPPPALALEIGCGPGNASLPLLERGYRVHAIELGEALKPGGGFALIWGSARRTAEDDRVDEALQPAYREHAPEISRETLDRMRGTVDEIAGAIRATPELRDFEERLFPQTHLLDRQRYLDTLATFSDHATLPEERRARLFEAIGEIIDRRFGGRVERHSMARLQLARRR